jgi:putative PIN family toxin of toxin-antitoxin system
MIVVLDTAVWISAMEFSGVAFEVLVKAASEDTIACSTYIEDEVERVLYTKFRWHRARVREDLRFYLKEAMHVETHGVAFPECSDPKDHAIIETALNAQAALLISGDRHLLTLGAYKGTQVVTLRRHLSPHLAALSA